MKMYVDLSVVHPVKDLLVMFDTINQMITHLSINNRISFMLSLNHGSQKHACLLPTVISVFQSMKILFNSYLTQ